MQKRLEAILNKIKNNPLEEKEIYEILASEDPAKFMTLLAKVAPRIDTDKMDATEVAGFVKAIQTKITSFREEDGNLKVIKGYEKIPFPTFAQCMKISSFLEKQTTAVRSYEEAKEDFNLKVITPEEWEIKVDEYLEFAKVNTHEHLDTMLEEITGVKMLKISTWEKNYLMEMTMERVKEPLETLLGKNLPN